MTTSLDDLIARLEKAEEPDRELDARIFAEIDDRDVVAFDMPEHLSGRSRKSPHDACLLGIRVSGGFAAEDYIPRYTASIDAAATAVPEGWFWHSGVSESANDADGPVGTARAYRWVDTDASGWEIIGDIEHKAGPALALCIAALKARKTEGAA